MIISHLRIGPLGELSAWGTAITTRQPRILFARSQGSGKDGTRTGIIIGSVLLVAGFVYLLVYYREIIFRRCLKGRELDTRRTWTRQTDYDDRKTTPLSPLKPYPQSSRSHYAPSVASTGSRAPLSPQYSYSTQASLRAPSRMPSRAPSSLRSPPPSLRAPSTIAHSRAPSQLSKHHLTRTASFAPSINSITPSYKDAYISTDSDFVPKRPPPVVRSPKSPTVFELPASPREPPRVFELPATDFQERSSSAPPTPAWIQQERGRLSPAFSEFSKISMDGTLQRTHSAADLSVDRSDSMLSRGTGRRIGGSGEKKFLSDVQNSTIAELPAEPVVFIGELEANPIYEIGPSPSRESMMEVASENVLREPVDVGRVKPPGNYI